MTDTRDGSETADPHDPDTAPVVVPYARFLEHRARRHANAAGSMPTDRPPAADAAATLRPADTVWKKS
jgi:hypothetical protein